MMCGTRQTLLDVQEKRPLGDTVGSIGKMVGRAFGTDDLDADNPKTGASNVGRGDGIRR